MARHMRKLTEDELELIRIMYKCHFSTTEIYELIPDVRRPTITNLVTSLRCMGLKQYDRTQMMTPEEKTLFGKLKDIYTDVGKFKAFKHARRKDDKPLRDRRAAA